MRFQVRHARRNNGDIIQDFKMSPVRNFVKAHKHEQKEINKTESFQSVINDSFNYETAAIIDYFRILDHHRTSQEKLWSLPHTSTAKQIK